VPISDFDSFKELVDAPFHTIPYAKATPSSASFKEQSPWATMWRQSGYVPIGDLPTAAVALDRDSVGAMPMPDTSSDMVVVGAESSGLRDTRSIGGGLLIDRLVHSGGLVGNVTTEQTTNLPTAALPRYTSGVGVWMGLHIWANLGATSTFATISYTNTADTAGRSAFVRMIGMNVGVNMVMVAQLQPGDLGVKSVQSVTLNASTGTAGNFGVVLFKPLSFIGWMDGHLSAEHLPGWNTPINPNACLDFLQFTGLTFAGSTTWITHKLDLAEI
jgi:hypothetical protein